MAIHVRKPGYGALFFVAAVAVASFSGSAFSFWNGTMQVITPSRDAAAVWLRIYEPPARKSVLVDAQGLAQRTADNMQLVQRDRSREIFVPKGGRRIQNIPVEVHPSETPAVRIEEAAEMTPANARIRLEAPRGPNEMTETDKTRSGAVEDKPEEWT